MEFRKIDTALRVLDNDPGGRQRRNNGAINPANERFVAKYRDLECGWYLASEFARRRLPFPITCVGSDRWVYRAYAHQLGNWDSVIAEARAINTEPTLRNDAAVLRAALICKDFDLQKLSDGTGYPLDVILAFEKLFFNVLDRQKDAMYLRSVIYPTSRVEELYQDYAKFADWATILIRVGFNRGLDTVMMMAGLTQGNVVKSGDTGAALADQLECTIMANALLIVNAGLGHGSENAVSLQHAKSLLTAAKQGGADTTAGSPVTTNDNNDPLLQQMVGFLEKNKRARATARKERLVLEVEAAAVD